MPCQAGTHAYTKGLTPLLMQQIYVPHPPLHPPFKQKTQNYLQFREDNALGQPTLQKRLAHFQVDETPNNVGPASHTDWPRLGWLGQQRTGTREGLSQASTPTPIPMEARLSNQQLARVQDPFPLQEPPPSALPDPKLDITTLDVRLSGLLVQHDLWVTPLSLPQAHALGAGPA